MEEYGFELNLCNNRLNIFTKSILLHRRIAYYQIYLILLRVSVSNINITTFGMRNEKDFIPSLTGIRALCAYGIFIYHTHMFIPDIAPKLRLLIQQLDTFITFFFVISGFIITHIYYDTKSLQRKELFRYGINRFARIFPILFILVTITFLIQFYRGSESQLETFKEFFLNISFIKGFSKEYILTGIGPSWTLSVDVLFYILAPLLFYFTKSIISLIKFTLLFYLIGILLTLLFFNKTSAGFFNDFPFTFYFTFFGRAFEFVCGIYLALVIKNEMPSSLLRKIGKHSTWIGIAIVILSLIGLYLVANFYQIEKANQTMVGIIINNLFMPTGAVFLFYGLIHYRSILQAFLSSKIMVELGNATYSFYLLHTSFLISWIFKFISKNIAITFMCMLVFSYIFYRLVEQPLAKLIRNRYSK